MLTVRNISKSFELVDGVDVINQYNHEKRIQNLKRGLNWN